MQRTCLFALRSSPRSMLVVILDVGRAFLHQRQQVSHFGYVTVGESRLQRGCKEPTAVPGQGSITAYGVWYSHVMPNRQSKGTPGGKGGQFAPGARTADVTLDEPLGLAPQSSYSPEDRALDMLEYGCDLVEKSDGHRGLEAMGVLRQHASIIRDGLAHPSAASTRQNTTLERARELFGAVIERAYGTREPVTGTRFSNEPTHPMSIQRICQNCQIAISIDSNTGYCSDRCGVEDLLGTPVEQAS